MTTGTKRVLLGLALGSTLVAAWFAPAPDDEVVLSARARAAAAPRAAAPVSAVVPGAAASGRGDRTSALEVLAIRPRSGADDEAEGDLFALSGRGRNTRAAAEAPAAPTAVDPGPPQAPPLPFLPFGRYDEGEQAIVFLEYQGRNLAVRVGDTIADEQYRVERLQEATLTLRYLPLNQLQTLDVGAVP